MSNQNEQKDLEVNEQKLNEADLENVSGGIIYFSNEELKNPRDKEKEKRNEKEKKIR